MKSFITLFAASLTVASALASGFELKESVMANPENEPAPVHPVPHERQMKWMETEFYAFFHYGMNTFTGNEWGHGNEAESIYNPLSRPNPRQWLESVKAAGMKGGIAVVKHHDGFCLWPTKTTTHCITSSTGEHSQVNIPKEFAEAARDLDMKYGFYVSPWDASCPYWGNGTNEYTEKVFTKQCQELCEYGTDQFEMWFDGASGGQGAYGTNGLMTRGISPFANTSDYYDVPNLRDYVHGVMPDCVMWGVGDEARWIGNEAGWAGETNWSYGSGTSGDPDSDYWKHGESDAKATNRGWFWHDGETPHSADRVWQFYMETVGRNATLILNYPPNNHGLLPDADVKVLSDFGKMLQQRLGTDLAPQATVTASVTRDSGKTRTYAAANVTDSNKDTYWAAPDGVIESSLTFIFPETTNVHYIALQEYVRLGQRVKKFSIETTTDGETWAPYSGMTTTTIGYKRIIALNGKTNQHDGGKNIKGVRINIEDAKACPTLHTVSIY